MKTVWTGAAGVLLALLLLAGCSGAGEKMSSPADSVPGTIEQLNPYTA